MKGPGKIAFFILMVMLAGVLVFGSALNFFTTGEAFSNYDFAGFGGGSSPTPALRSECTRVSLDTGQSKVPSFSGSPAALVFDCKNGNPAFFTTGSRADLTRAIVPTFDLPSGWALSVGLARSHGDCSTKDKMIPLSDGGPVRLRTDSGYIYCLTTNNASTFSSFAITWSQ